jgi:hypothetical protein
MPPTSVAAARKADSRTPNTRESSHLAYEDTPSGVCALVRPDTTIRLIVKPGAF